MKAFATAAIAVMLAVCIVPALSDASDAYSEDHRYSTVFLLGASVYIEDDQSLQAVSGCYYFFDGSAADRRMDSYIRNPYGTDIGSGEMGWGETLPAGSTVNVYMPSLAADGTIPFQGVEVEADTVLEPYGERFYTMTCESTNISCSFNGTSNRGETVNALIEFAYGWEHVHGSIFSSGHNVGDEIGLVLNGSTDLYVDMHMEVENATLAGVSDNDDGYQESCRHSHAYLMRTSLVKTDGMSLNTFDSCLFFIDGSYMDTMMESYISNPTDTDNHVFCGDIDWSTDVPSGTMINAYYVSYDRENRFEIDGRMYDAEVVLEPYGMHENTAYAKAGDTVHFEGRALTNEGRELEFGIEYEFSNTYVESSWTHTFDRNSTITFYPNEYSGTPILYVDISYSMTGADAPPEILDPDFREPDTPIGMCMLPCLVVAVLIIAVLVYTGLRPKWSK